MDSIDEVKLRCRAGTSIETSNGPEPAPRVNMGDSSVVRLPAPQLESVDTQSENDDDICPCGWLRCKCPNMIKINEYKYYNCGSLSLVPCECDEDTCYNCKKIYKDCECEDIEGSYSYCIECGCDDCNGCGGAFVETVHYHDKIQKEKNICDLCNNLTICGRNTYCKYKCNCYEKCEGCENYIRECMCDISDYERKYEQALNTRHEHRLTKAGCLLMSSLPLYRLLYDDIFTNPFLDYMRSSRVNPTKLSIYMFKISVILSATNIPIEIMDHVVDFIDINITEEIKEIASLVPMNRMIQYV
jgi:hypothetical protein